MRRSKTGSVPAASGETTDPARLAKLKFSVDRPAHAEELAVSMALIDPKPLTRQSILETLTQALPDFMTVAVSSCNELTELQGRPPSCPQLVVIHTRTAQLTDPWVQNVLEFMKRHLTSVPVVLLSDRDDVDDIVKALAYGVRGYIPTSVEAEVFFAALRLINAGGTFIPAHAVRSAAAKPDSGSDCKERGLPNAIALTSCELSVVDLLREGKPNKLIAIELKMQESTVKVHIRNIFKKLHATNRTQAATIANQLFGEARQTVASLTRSGSGSSIQRV